MCTINKGEWKLVKDKTAIAIALFLMMTLAITVIALPAANAHTPPWTIPTFAFLNVAPSPVGVGQTAYVNFWVDKVPPTAIGNWGTRWHGMTVTVTKPDGTTQTLGPFDSDATGGAWTQITPDKIGNYRFVFHFPEQTAKVENPYPYQLGFVSIGEDFINDTYSASTSKEVTLVVQEEQVTTAYPSTPLPTEYWARPINSMNRDWYTIGGNWLGLSPVQFSSTGVYGKNGNFNPYTTAPNSAHVMWTQPIAFGGQIGGEFGPSETSLYATGTAYEPKFAAVVLYGNLYYTQYPGAANNIGPLKAVNLRTGETLWTVNASNPLRCGMIYNFITGDQYGAHAYLFTAPAMIGFVLTPEFFDPKWSMYDAMTGQWILDIANASEGVLVRGTQGEILSYSVGFDGTLNLWNISKCIAAASQKNNIYLIYSSAEIWRPPIGATIDWNDGYEWSVPIATEISGAPIGGSGLGIVSVSDGVILTRAADTSTPGGSQTGWEVEAGYSAVDGSLLWGPVNRTLTPFTYVTPGDDVPVLGEGVYGEWTEQKLTWTGYSLKTGEKLWETTPKNSSWGVFEQGIGIIGYGNLYTWGLGGEAYAYDLKTGVLNWSWSAGSSGVDTPYGTWPLGTFSRSILADGKLFVFSGHDYTPPVFKGAKIYCLNATTGELIWSSLSFSVSSGPVCTDGVMVNFNAYDNQIYAYGKGPTATTVEAPLTSSTFGDSIVIQGTVTDISPGTNEYVQTARFPNGVPAISDESQSAWMAYLYQQQPKPADATGVPVTIDVIDSNDNYRNIGTATSDVDGFFSFDWQPDIPGKYTVIVTFAGSESYYASHAKAAFVVDEPTSATPAPTQAPASLADQYLLPATGGIIAAIAIVGAAILLMLRKK